MSYATTYATPEVLEATWEAVSPGATGGAIEIRPYPTATSRAGGGFARPAPPAAPPGAVGDSAWAANTYTDRMGNRQWLPTPEEAAWHRRNGFPVPGIDDLPDHRARPPRPVPRNPATSVGRAAGGSLDDVMRGVGGAGGLATGGLLAGGIAGYAEYQSGGGVASAVAVGVGAGVGSAVGTVIGGVAGSALGPVGTVVGGMIGGALGSAIGGAIGDALIPDANLNGVSAEGTDPPFSGGQGVGVSYQVQSELHYEQAVGYHHWRNGWIVTGWEPHVSTSIRTVLGPIRGLVARYSPAHFRDMWHVVSGVNSDQFTNLDQDANPIFDPSHRRNWQDPILTIWRTDGQPDPHGDPAPTPVPYNPNARPRPATGTPDFRLPGVDLPRPQPRPIFGNPRLRDPNPFGEPSPEPNPDPTDDPYPYPYPWPRPTPTPGPTPDPAPYPDPTDDPNPNPNPNPNPDDDDQENCNPCAKLDEILEKLESQEEPMLLTPEWWAYRAGSERPQLLVVYALKNADGSWSRTRFQFNIPWFDNRKRRVLKSILPKKIQKGRHQGTLTLTDNSKMIQFCRNQSESERVLKAFEKLVIPRYKTGDIRFADTNGNAKRKFREITVELMEARFYAQGQREESPSWKEKFY